MCHKIRLFHFQYFKSKNSANYHKFLKSRFWEIVFFVSLLFRRHVCLCNLKHALPLTALQLCSPLWEEYIGHPRGVQGLEEQFIDDRSLQALHWNLKELAPFSSFNPFQCLNIIILNSKTGPLFLGFSWFIDTFWNSVESLLKKLSGETIYF